MFFEALKLPLPEVSQGKESAIPQRTLLVEILVNECKVRVDHDGNKVEELTLFPTERDMY